MKVLGNLVRSKWLMLLLMSLPFCNLIWQGNNGGFEANPVEFVLLQTGWAGMQLFLLVLFISPLKAIFPKNRLLRALGRHKRLIGLSCFAYVLLHFLVYLLDSGDVHTLLENLGRPFILFGTSAFIILFALAITSWNRAIKMLGGKHWKALHRLSYLAIFLVLLHMLDKEKSNVLLTLAYFIPLACVQLFRIYHNLSLKKNKQSKSMSAY